MGTEVNVMFVGPLYATHCLAGVLQNYCQILGKQVVDFVETLSLCQNGQVGLAEEGVVTEFLCDLLGKSIFKNNQVKESTIFIMA